MLSETQWYHPRKDNPVQKWWHVSWKRVFIALLTIIVSLGVLAGVGTLAFYQLTPWMTARALSRDDPRLNLLPLSLPDKSLATPNGIRIECDRFSFQAPWKEVVRDKIGTGISCAAFSSGGTIYIFGPDKMDWARVLRSDARTARVLGRETIASNYAMTVAEVSTTSDQVKWWRTRGQNARSYALFVWKSTALNGQGPLYAVSFGELHGFQEGNPSVAPYRVDLNLFDSGDRHYEISISAEKDSGPILSQPEINAIVASFHPIPHN
jgi:hypothetical protein